MEDCISLIEKAILLPLSIIIIGVGPANFSKMNSLDGNGGDLNKKRDLV